MRVTVLTTRTNNTPAFYEPLHGLGHHVSVIVYDILSPDAFNLLPYLVEQNRPNFVVMVGAHENYHDRPVPPVQVLAEIGAKFPLVHMCCDGAEQVWWPQIQKYYNEGRFALQINIDGTRVGPIGERGMTLLSPFDPKLFPDPPPAWESRPIMLGFAGSRGHQSHMRGKFIDDLLQAGLVAVRDRDSNGHAEGYRSFLCHCKAVWNAPWTGGGDTMHVKGRPLEAAHAGAVLFEYEGSPLEDWFKRGEDFVSYKSVEDVRCAIEWMRQEPDAAMAMASRFRKRVIEEHSPEVFWDHVLGRLGLKADSRPLVQPPLRMLPPVQQHQQHQPYFDPHPASGGGVPVLVETRGTNNLVQYGGRIYVIPHRLGTIDLASPVDRRKPGIVAFDSLNAARHTPVY